MQMLQHQRPKQRVTVATLHLPKSYYPMGKSMDTLTDGAVVATLTDQIGSFDLTQSTGSKKPLVEVDNGFGVEFDATDDNMSKTGSPAVTSGPLTMVACVTINDAVTLQTIFSLHETTNYRWGMVIKSNEAICSNDHGPAIDKSGAVTTGRHVLICRGDGAGVVEVMIDGVLGTGTTSGGTGNTQGTMVGDNTGGGTPFDGIIWELGLFGRSISDSEARKITKGLAQRYGVAL